MSMMKFYMTPGSCTTGIHILLEELGLLFECHLVNLLAGDHRKPEYLQMNPKGTVPVLVCDDETVLTDYQAIAWWLARRYPRSGLLPVEPGAEFRIVDMMNYAVATIHMQGFARLFTTEQFSPNQADQAWVRQQGREIIERGFNYVDGMLGNNIYVTGDFSIADSALFYVEFWADKTDIELPAHCQRHYRNMLKRPAVRQVLAEEGYALS